MPQKIVAYNAIQEHTEHDRSREDGRIRPSNMCRSVIILGISNLGTHQVAYDVKALERQEGGSHYDLPIQPIEYIVANEIPYREGNVIKYTTRHRSKNGVEDIKKAIHYLEMILEEYEDEDRKAGQSSKECDHELYRYEGSEALYSGGLIFPVQRHGSGGEDFVPSVPQELTPYRGPIATGPYRDVKNGY